MLAYNTHRPPHGGLHIRSIIMVAKSDLDLVRVSLMLPAELLAWLDAEVKRGRASSRSEVVRVIVQKARLAEKIRTQSGERRIGLRTITEIKKDYMAGRLAPEWLDGLTEEEQAYLAKVFDDLDS